MNWTPEQLAIHQAKRGATGAIVTRIAVSKAEAAYERELHRIFRSWLLLNDIPFIHCPMNKPTTIKPGWPDFTVFHDGKTCFVEFKRDGEKPRDEQGKIITQLMLMDFPVLVSSSALEAIEFVREKLGVK